MLSAWKRILQRLRNEQGMIDLSSIMTGAIVTGILGAVTSVTFLAVIPWFQNNTAKDDINLVKIAQESYYSDMGQYGTFAQLTQGELREGKRYLDAQQIASKRICVQLIDAGTYNVYVESSSKDIFIQKPEHPKPVKHTGAYPGSNCA